MARILVLGAGGLGCEIIKSLILYKSFSHLEIIDMDIVEMSNLNRQFMFGKMDIGKSKALVVLDYIKEFWPQAKDKITAKHCDLRSLEPSFYAQFHIIITGLDSVETRRWVNGLVIQLSFVGIMIPLIDGGSEGYKGHVSVILHGITACIECLLPLFSNALRPICTLVGKPRTIEQCIDWSAYVDWDNHFNRNFDIEIEEDLNWIYESAKRRAISFGIDSSIFEAVDIHNHLKIVIPSISTTNAAIAGICAFEAERLIRGETVGENYTNFIMYNSEDGINLSRLIISKVRGCICDDQKENFIKTI